MDKDQNAYPTIIVGAGLAGLVAAYEITRKGKKALIIDQEPEQNIGGQAYWSLGGLFLVDTPEQRRLGIRDSYELALQDWMGTAGFDREEERYLKVLKLLDNGFVLPLIKCIEKDFSGLNTSINNNENDRS